MGNWILSDDGLHIVLKTQFTKLTVDDGLNNLIIDTPIAASGGALTTGIYNIGIGPGTLAAMTTGRYAVAMGPFALAGHNATLDSYVTGIGFGALGGPSLNSRWDVAIGAYALFNPDPADSTVQANVVIGGLAWTDDDYTTVHHGTQNVIIGYRCAENVTSTHHSIFIGADLQGDSATTDYQLNIGGAIKGDLSTLAITFPGVIHITGGSIFVTEKAAADADIAGKGQIWVKNTTPNELWFTDDAGTDHQIAFV